MKPTFFIHASVAVLNKWDLPSLILEEVNGDSLLKLLLLRLKKCRSFEAIYIVTSDEPCDEAVVKIAESCNNSAEVGCSYSVLKIPADSGYAFCENNRVLGRGNFLYKAPVYGFYSAEGMMHFAQQMKFETAVLTNAEEIMLMEPLGLDTLIDKYGKEETIISALAIIPLDVLISTYRQQKITSDKNLKVDMDSIDDAGDDLKRLKLYPDDKIAEIVQQKKEALSNIKNQLMNVRSLIMVARDKNRRGEIGVIPEMAGNENVFFLLYTKEHLLRIKGFLSNIAKLSLDNFFELGKSEFEFSNKEMPGYLEIEITSHCNLACANCPQTKLTRLKQHMDVAVFKKIVDKACNTVPFLSLSGFGEPTLHPQLLEFVRYAKQKNFLRVCLETNGVTLTDEMISDLIAAGLDVLVLNLDALDKYSGKEKSSEAVIESIFAIKAKNNSNTPYLVLQTVKTSMHDDDVLRYYNRWEYLVEAIVIGPYNDFLGVFEQIEAINFSPKQEVASICKKTMHSLMVFSDGSVSFCKQKFDSPLILADSDIFEQWRKNRMLGLKQDFCKKCNQWCLLDFPGIATYPNAGIVQSEKHLYADLIPAAIKQGQECFIAGNYEEALDVWEKVLKFDPSNAFIHQKLDELLDKSS